MKKNRIKKRILFGLAVLFFTMQLQAQNIDTERMKRDLAVTENVLSTLLSETSDSKFFVNKSLQNTKGEYIKDYGVIFTFNNSVRIVSGFAAAPRGYTLRPNEVRVVPGAPSSGIVIGRKRADREDEKEEADSKSQEEMEKKRQTAQQEAKDHFIQAAKDFLADYAHLIKQLKNEDRIMVRMNNESAFGLALRRNFAITIERDGVVDGSSTDEASEEVMVEAVVKDIHALQKEQISRDAFMRKVKVTEVERSFEKKADLEMIASMFYRLYQQDLSDTYYTLSGIPYSSIQGLGVVFNMRVYSSYESDRVFYLPSTGEKGLNLEERNEKVQELLPQFEQSFKENLVNYGRSVKSLEKDELLIFEVQLTKCKDCEDFPKALKFSIKKSVLDDFNEGKISESQAIGQVSVEKEF
jgi:hypothetical protein